jgi:hypothetical protein
VIPQGSEVEVVTCASGWCEVEYRGMSGFASQNYLSVQADDRADDRADDMAGRVSGERGASSGGWDDMTGQANDGFDDDDDFGDEAPEAFEDDMDETW